MAITLNEIKSRLRPYLLVHLKSKILDLLSDSDFLQIFNDVAKDLNEQGQLNIERYNKSTGSVAAENDDYTNYLLQGIIIKILYFKYDSYTWEDQKYTYQNDRLALKTAPAEGVEMDIRYLRDCEVMTDITDQVDLPDNVVPEYVELLKVRLRIDYGGLKASNYEEALQFYGDKAGNKVQQHAVKEMKVFRRWMNQTGDDTIYDITDQWISLDNFLTDVNGNLVYTGE